MSPAPSDHPLLAAGYHVVVPDIRGNNMSSMPEEVVGHRPDTLAVDIVALADAFGADRFHLVEIDRGAVICWWVGATHADAARMLAFMTRACGKSLHAIGGPLLNCPELMAEADAGCDADLS